MPQKNLCALRRAILCMIAGRVVCDRGEKHSSNVGFKNELWDAVETLFREVAVKSKGLGYPKSAHRFKARTHPHLRRGRCCVRAGFV